VAAVGATVLLLAPAGLVAPPTARAAGPDLTLVTSATYTVSPAKGRVNVTVDVTIANHRAETRTNTYYFDHAFLAVQPGVVNLRLVKGPAGAAAHVSSRSANATLLRLDFGRLSSGRSTSLRFAFDLASVGSGARQLIRVGTSLVTFPVWAYASDGTSGSRATVHFPKGYDVTVESGSFATRTTAPDGGIVLATGALANPLGFFAYVSAQQPTAYRATSLSVRAGSETIPLTLRAWRDDKAWGTRVGSLLAKALPALRRDIGVPWPHDGAVVVQEAVNRRTGGFAGSYDPQPGTIEVAYWASPAVIVHEAAHGWFNGTLLADRWAAEGFASYYAQRAFKGLKITAAAPKITAALKKAAFPLNDWPATATSATNEAYGAAASYALAALIAQRAGPNALARVWADAEAGVGAYQPTDGQGGGAPETVDGPPDWRGLLDLLETETGADFTDLWRTWVLRNADAALLDQRSAAQAAYHDLLAATDGWALPSELRDAMRAWRFDTATSMISAARAALAERATLEADAAQAGLTLPPMMQARFEAGDFAGATAAAAEEETAIAAIRSADAERGTAAADPVAAVGLFGASPEQTLTAAKAVLAAGDPAGAVTKADAAAGAWDAAFSEGRRRLLMGVSLAAAIAILVVSLVTHLARPRGPRAAARAR
jgi:hypothetical protein